MARPGQACSQASDQSLEGQRLVLWLFCSFLLNTE